MGQVYDVGDYIDEAKTIKVLRHICDWQGYDGANYSLWCSDGNVYSYEVSEYGVTSLYCHSPKWKCKNGDELALEEMSPSHRKNAIAAVRRKFDENPERAMFWLVWLGEKV